MAYRYLVVFEREGGNYGASVPDLSGCVAIGKSLPAVKKLIREGIALHVEDMLARGERPPKPRARVDYVDAKVA